MSSRRINIGIATIFAAAFSLIFPLHAAAAPQPSPAQSAAGRAVGTIKSINGNTIVLAPDSGAQINVTVADDARLLRIEPGQTDLKSASPIELKDLQVGDRILVRGSASSDGKSISAMAIVAMKRTDIQAKQKQEEQQWQRGIGGLVSAVDPTGGTVTVSVVTPAGVKPVTVHVTQSTIIRRYAPSSIDFQDAKPGTLDQVKPGDQLRARGTKSEDGASFQADEIVSGSFRNIEGTISGVDVSANTLDVMDLSTKKKVLVKIASNSQLRTLPQPIAQRVAMLMKGGAAKEGNAAGEQETQAGQGAPGGPASGMAQPPGGRGIAGDFQQVLGRLPQSSLSDMQKGQAVMIVGSEGPDATVTAITLVSGVEPILEASPKGGQSMLLSPWNVGGAPAGGEGDQ
jgi:hypothetical protein